MADQTIIDVDGLLAAASESGHHTIDATGGPLSDGVYPIDDDLVVTAQWDSFVPIGGDVTIDCTDTYTIKIGKSSTLGDPTYTNTLKCINSVSTFTVEDTAAKIVFNGYDMEFSGNAANGVSFVVGYGHPVSEANFYRSKAFDNGTVGPSDGDGFNIHGDGGVDPTERGVMRLYACEAYGHTGTNDDGATAHELTELYIYGGSYHDNEFGVHSIEKSKTYIDGSTSWGACSFDDNVVNGILINDGGGVGPAFVSITGAISIEASAVDNEVIAISDTATADIQNANFDFTGHIGDGILLDSTGSVTVKFNVFRNLIPNANKAALRMESTTLTGNIEHNTFYNNDIHYRTGVINTALSVKDNILSTGTTDDWAIFNSGINYNTQMDAGYNLFHDNSNNLFGAGSLEATDVDYTGTLAVLFTDAPNNDFTLPLGSPAIKTGTDGSSIGALQYEGVDLQPYRSGFAVNATTPDASGKMTMLAAAADKSHYISAITISCISAITVTVQDNTSTPVTILGPVPFNTTSKPVEVVYPDPIKVDSGKQVDVISSGSGDVNITIQGYTE